MSLAPPPPPPPPPPRLRRLFAAAPLPTVAPRSPLTSCARGGGGRAYCLFSGGGNRKKQDEARKALENALGQKKTEFDKWGVEIERRRQRGRSGGPAAGGGGWSGGGRWFRWLTSGGFWDAARQAVLTILGIIAAVFLIANFNAMIAAVVNSLLVVLRQIRRALSFVALCVSQGASVPRSGTKSSNPDSGNLAGLPVHDRVKMSAKERVVRKWGMD
ncbi:hypothetical protein ACP4OV_031679 [Aristida adscensionis]